jgi:predicted protein tyrosine phosphatase
VNRVEFVSRREAEAMRPKSDANVAIISINSDDKLANLSENWKYKLPLIFEDIDKPLVHKGRELILFNGQMAKRIIEFVDSIQNDITVLIVHCDAGVSRSAAVAKFIAEMYHLEIPETYSIYNRHIYRTLWNEVNGY